MRTTVLIAPSMAAVVELPRRLAMTGNAVSGLYAFKLLDLARALAEPTLLGRGLQAWDGGHDALLAARLLAEDPGGGFPLAADLPKGPVAATLARTLSELRRWSATPESLEALAAQADANPEDQARLRTLARLYRGFHSARDDRVADHCTVLRSAAVAVNRASWLEGAEVVVVEDVEAGPLEREFLAALGRVASVKVLRRPLPAALAGSSFRAWAPAAGIRETTWEETALAPLAPPPAPGSLERLRSALFEPPRGARGGRRRGRARHRARRGGRGAGDRAAAAARGGARRALRGDGRRPSAARDLRPALHRPPRAPRHPAPPAPLAAPALRPRRALAAPPLPLPRASSGRR